MTHTWVAGLALASCYRLGEVYSYLPFLVRPAPGTSARDYTCAQRHFGQKIPCICGPIGSKFKRSLGARRHLAPASFGLAVSSNEGRRCG
jgi:hypothetical protein